MESWREALEEEAPLHILVVNNNYFDVEVRELDELRHVGVIEDDDFGWVERQVRPRTPPPMPTSMELTIATAVLPEDTSAL